MQMCINNCQCSGATGKSESGDKHVIWMYRIGFRRFSAREAGLLNLYITS